ncbi:MAG: hypothetical protein KatS3mg126_0914 [Lysobacteraceae bacterium]|nr:MAG: hypothetical protein KatS3mg126_0914 [Xanthomonadaceae bacterium]
MHPPLRTSMMVFGLLTLLTGCQRTAQTPTADAPATPAASDGAVATNPHALCVITTLDGDLLRSLCVPGQKVAFLPMRWGNEQLPLYFAASNCDLRYSVAITNGGVVCQYMPQPDSEDEDSDASSDGLLEEDQPSVSETQDER